MTTQREINALIEAAEDALEALFNWGPRDARDNRCFNAGRLVEKPCPCTACKLDRAVKAIKVSGQTRVFRRVSERSQVKGEANPCRKTK